MAEQTRGAEVVIRRATIDDAEVLSVLGALLFEQAFGAANTPEDMRAFLTSTFSPAAQRAEIRDSERATFVAESNGVAIGYAVLRCDRRGDGVVGERPVEVHRIYVDREWHGRRVGEALMTACVEQARVWDGDVLWLGVWQENPRAISFYTRSGFDKVGVQSFLLGTDLQQDFVMARRLV
jgi:ribosomal protein S18 acetylase RimI-like enzyme